jgi:DNA-binding CsgD family transcriptional regulator
MNNSEHEKLITAKVREVAAYANDIPGVVIIHEVSEFRVRYMSDIGLRLLGKKWEDIEGLSGQEYHERFFNPEFAQYVAPKLLALVEGNTEETLSFFQQVRTNPESEWDWYMSMLKILLRDPGNRPLLTISVAMKIDPSHYFTAKMARLMEENRFLREHHEKFSLLTKREREILKMLATGMQNAVIAKELHISVTTAETHRKRIRQKLGAKTNFELTQYAQAFDML